MSIYVLLKKKCLVAADPDTGSNLFSREYELFHADGI